MIQFMGALRVTARAANILTPKPLLHHSFSTFHRVSPSLLRTTVPSYHLQHRYFSPTIATTTSNRHFSLANLLTRRKPVQTPSPAVVANIALIEADANASPHNPQKQIALFEALMQTKNKAGYDLVATRWERMCEFVRPVLFFYY